MTSIVSLFSNYVECSYFFKAITVPGISLGMRPANERWRYNVMTSLIDWHIPRLIPATWINDDGTNHEKTLTVLISTAILNWLSNQSAQIRIQWNKYTKYSCPGNLLQIKHFSVEITLSRIDWTENIVSKAEHKPQISHETPAPLSIIFIQTILLHKNI